MLTPWEAFFQSFRERYHAFIAKDYPLAAPVSATGYPSFYDPFPIGFTYAVPPMTQGPDRGPGMPLPEDTLDDDRIAA